MFDTPAAAPGAAIEPRWHSAYIAPDGTFHYVPTHRHCDVASIMCALTGKHADDPEDIWYHRYYSDCDDTLKATGWIHLTEGHIAHMRPATYQQRDTLYEVGAYIASHDEFGDMLKGFRSSFPTATGEDWY